MKLNSKKIPWTDYSSFHHIQVEFESVGITKADVTLLYINLPRPDIDNLINRSDRIMSSLIHQLFFFERNDAHVN